MRFPNFNYLDVSIQFCFCQNTMTITLTYFPKQLSDTHMPKHEYHSTLMLLCLFYGFEQSRSELCFVFQILCRTLYHKCTAQNLIKV